MTKTERLDLIRERHQARDGILRVVLMGTIPTVDELPQADTSDLVRKYQETTHED